MANDFTKVNNSVQNDVQKVSLRKINEAKKAEEKQSEKLATGKKINSAADDAAGFAIAEQIHSQIQGLDMASKNSQDGISMLQTAEGSLGGVSDMLTRARELTIQASNETLTESDRKIIQDELKQIGEGIEDVAKNTEFNEKKLLDGSAGKVKLQVGANEGQTKDVNMSTDFSEMAEKIKNLDVVNGDLGTQLETIDKSIDEVSSVRADLGATMNTLDSTIKSIDNTSDNLSNAKSVIADTDMAKAVMEKVRYDFRRNAATTMLAQSEELLGGLGSVVR